MDTQTVSLIYGIIALLVFFAVLILAATWDGGHSNFARYYLGVTLDMQGWWVLIRMAASIAVLWPLAIIILCMMELFV